MCWECAPPSGQQLHLLSELCPSSKQQLCRWMCNACAPKLPPNTAPQAAFKSHELQFQSKMHANALTSPAMACIGLQEVWSTSPCVACLWKGESKEKVGLCWSCSISEVANQRGEWRILAVWSVHSAIAKMQNVGRKMQIWSSSLSLYRNNGEIEQKPTPAGGWQWGSPCFLGGAPVFCSVLLCYQLLWLNCIFGEVQSPKRRNRESVDPRAESIPLFLVCQRRFASVSLLGRTGWKANLKHLQRANPGTPEPRDRATHSYLCFVQLKARADLVILRLERLGRKGLSLHSIVTAGATLSATFLSNAGLHLMLNTMDLVWSSP